MGSKLGAQNHTIKTMNQFAQAVFQAEIQERAEKMRAEVEYQCSLIKSSVSIELLRLPLKIRQMRAKDFFETYHGDVSEALAPATLSAAAAVMAIPTQSPVSQTH